MDNRTQTGHIVPLDDLKNYKVTKGDPDPRGWDVKAADGRKIGEVDKLLVDTDAKQVRYLDVDLDHSDRHTLIPIGQARLDDTRDEVIVQRMPSVEPGTLPAYNHQPLTRDDENRVLDSWVPETQWTSRPEPEFYNHACFDERQFFGARRR